MKPIAHFENRYLIGEDGTIMNLANNTPLKPTVLENGYLKVGLKCCEKLQKDLISMMSGNNQ